VDLDLDSARAAFEQSTDFTVGIEEEFALLDSRDLGLTGRFDEIKEAAGADPVLAGSIARNVNRLTRAAQAFDAVGRGTASLPEAAARAGRFVLVLDAEGKVLQASMPVPGTVAKALAGSVDTGFVDGLEYVGIPVVRSGAVTGAVYIGTPTGTGVSALTATADLLRGFWWQLLVAGAVTLEICVLIGLPLNFANIVALPLLLGVGVAFKIYYVTAWRSGRTNLLQSSLTRAIFFSALTTATAFGSLWLSSHPGTASMGKLLALSLVTTLAAVLLFQPALMGKPRDVGE